MKVCPSCRWHNRPDAQACASCRGPLGPDVIIVGAAQPSQHEPTHAHGSGLARFARPASVAGGFVLFAILAVQFFQGVTAPPSLGRFSDGNSGTGASGLGVADDDLAHVREHMAENFTTWMFAGQYGSGTYGLARETTIGYRIEVLSRDGRFDACIFRAEDWTRFQRNESYQGWACHKGARLIDETVSLPAGHYNLGTLCHQEAPCTLKESLWTVTAAEAPDWKSAPRPRTYYAASATVNLSAAGRHVANFTLAAWSLLHYEVATHRGSGAVTCILDEKDRQAFLRGAFAGRMCSRKEWHHAGAHLPGGEWSLGIHCWSSQPCPGIVYSAWSEPPRGTPAS